MPAGRAGRALTLLHDRRMPLRRAVSAARAKLAHYAALRELTPDHGRLALRKLIKRHYVMPLWLRTRSGLSVYMSEDPLDDLALEATLQTKAHVYFPPLPWATDGGLFVDLGAWHGFYTLEVLRRYPGARIVAVEPDSWNCALLRRNLAANGFTDRAQVIEAAVGSSEGFGRLVRSGNTMQHRLVEDGQPGSGIRVVGPRGVVGDAQPLVVKCNAEGAEFSFFPQLFRLGRRPRLIIVEVHAAYGDTDALLAVFRQSGYSVSLADRLPHGAWFHCWLT